MKTLVKNTVDEIFKMESKERNILLCQLLVKEMNNTILPDEIIQLSTIQAIRKANGEIDRVLENWKKYPELDPRIKN